MKRKITRISVLQTGKFLAIFYTLLIVIMVPFFLLAALGDSSMLVILPMLLIYPIMGFIGGILMATFYNLTAKWVGGIEVTVQDSEEIYSEPIT
jgi:hypothetical protein